MNKRTLIFLIAIVVAFPALAFAGEAEDAILKGNQHVQSKDYQKAIKEYERALKANPKHAKANLLLGLTYANVGDNNNAIKYSEISSQLEPSYSAYHNLGLIYANKGEFEKSLEAYKKALDLNPTSFRGWYQIGLLHASQLRFNEAIEAYKKAIEINPKFPNAYLGLGSAYYWSGDKPAALQQIDALKSQKFKNESVALKQWVDDKETKKKEAAAAASVSSPASSQ